LLALPNYEIVAVSNSTVESSERSIKHHNLPASTKAYGNAEDLAKDPNVDLVVVSVFVGRHYELTKPAIAHGKDVFVEWPLGASVAEAKELTELAAAKGVKTIVGLQSRTNPLYHQIKEVIASGKIGKVISTTVTVASTLAAGTPFPKGVEFFLDLKSGGNSFTIVFGHCKCQSLKWSNMVDIVTNANIS
jgi:predicted dehydrogenase